MATHGTITINNQYKTAARYNTDNYSCHQLLSYVYNSQFRDYLLQVVVEVGGTYNFTYSANGRTCCLYYGGGAMKSFGTISNGRINISNQTITYTATDVQRNPTWFSRINIGAGAATNPTSQTSASFLPSNGSTGIFKITMYFNVPDWFEAGEPIAQANNSNREKVHKFIQYFYSGELYYPFRISPGNIASPLGQKILVENGQDTPGIGTKGSIMSHTVEDNILYNTYINRTFTA